MCFRLPSRKVSNCHRARAANPGPAKDALSSYANGRSPLAHSLQNLSGRVADVEVTMGRKAGWILGAVLAVALYATPAAAQVSVSVGIGVPPVAAGVVIGGPVPVYPAYPPYYYYPYGYYPYPVYGRAYYAPRYYYGPRGPYYYRGGAHYYGGARYYGGQRYYGAAKQRSGIPGERSSVSRRRPGVSGQRPSVPGRQRWQRWNARYSRANGRR